jgi:DNA polymerase-1
MVNSHNALAEAGLATRTILQIHDELLFEGPPGEMEQATEIVTREMVGAAEMDPPLAVDAGVGLNWLDAK